MFSAIESRLTNSTALDGERLFNSVDSAFDFSELKNKTVSKARQAFILPLGEKPKVLENDLAGSVHHMVASFAVVIGVKCINDPKRKKGNALLEQVKAALRKELLGFSPLDGYQPLVLNGSKLLSMADNGLWWMETFSTTYYLESTYDN